MNRYRTDIKRHRRNIAISAVAVIAFILLAYSVGAKEDMTGDAESGVRVDGTVMQRKD